MSEAFPERLKRLRKEKKMSQTGLSVLSGVPQTSISNYELRKGEPLAWALEAIADVLGVSMDYLWRGK